LEQQVVDSYKYYFKVNYFGNRGPLHIGHHFSKWNKGAYWSAMKKFTKFVCGKPDVKCVTYKEYTEWLEDMERRSPETLAAYRAGNFRKLRDDNTIKNIATPVLAEVRLEESSEGLSAIAEPQAVDRMAAMGWRTQLSVNFEPVQANGSSMSREALISKIGVGKSALVRAAIVNRNGEEVNWETRRLEKIGTDEEYLTMPLEDRAVQGESIEAHSIEE
jgi:hypothetical protein